MRNTLKHAALLAAGLAGAAMATMPAKAAFLLTATRANNFSSTTAGVIFFPLNDAGATTLTFKTGAANEKVRITYNAECGAIGPATSWVNAVIQVDGAEAAPASGAGFAMCSGNGSTTFDWVGTVRQSVITVPVAGTHKLTVSGQLNNGATQLWQGDSSVVVDH